MKDSYMSDTDSMRYKSLKCQKKISAAQIQDGIMGWCQIPPGGFLLHATKPG